MRSFGGIECGRVLALAVTLTGVPVLAGAGAGVGSAISDPAYSLVTERVGADRASFYVYRDQDSGFNHGFPSGLFASAPATMAKIHPDAACIDDPSAANGCSTDPNQLDRSRGTVLRILFDPLSAGEFAGVNIEEPENWGSQPRGQGYDLRGATDIVFDVRTTTPQGINMEFGVGGAGHTTFLPVSQSWTTKRIALASLGLSEAELADAHIVFSVGTNDKNAPSGATVLLDNIRFEPVPVSQGSAVRFPLSTQTFGVVPRGTPDPGRVPFPSDQVLRNLTTNYESALTLLALLARGTSDDLGNARLVADAFDHATWASYAWRRPRRRLATVGGWWPAPFKMGTAYRPLSNA